MEKNQKECASYLYYPKHRIANQIVKKKRYNGSNCLKRVPDKAIVHEKGIKDL